MELDFQRDPAILRLLVESMPEGVFTVDAQGLVVAWSAGAERITGHAPGGVVGSPCRKLDGSEGPGFGKVAEAIASYAPGAPERVTSAYAFRHRDGRELHLELTACIVRDESGQAAGAVGSFADVTRFVLAGEKIALLEEQARSRVAFHGLVGKSAAMQEVFRRLRLAAQSDVTVILTGESGTGKEVAAGAIHALSARKDRPFIAVNCSAIPETLLESELFGHVKGAFTGAVRDKTGVFQAADGSTLFLDEIGDVSPLLQLKLLRVLQEREIRRVGDDRTSKVDVRLITATNQDLPRLLASGAMREDFYYRIRVFEVALPPLRRRREDIPLLADHFVHEFSLSHGKEIVGITREAMQRLMAHPWPGNIRELRNALEHAFVTVDGDRIRLVDLPPELGKPASPASKTESVPLSAEDRNERARIETALRTAQGNRTQAARQLGVSRVTLWKKMKRFHLDGDDTPPVGE